jgi:LAS superfamily LD-carboxypeptidase LdcB
MLSARKAWGYINGQPVELSLRGIGGGLYLETSAADAFNRMREHAAHDGVALIPSGERSAFRTSEDQASILKERGSISAGGFAAQVNKSPHQAGRAIDVETAGGTNRAYGWLINHAYLYGYRRTVGIEPWHWEYLP